MATTTFTNQTVFETTSGNGFVAGLRARFERSRAISRTVNELSRLSNRELDDLGISRADIPAVARRAAASNR